MRSLSENRKGLRAVLLTGVLIAAAAIFLTVLAAETPSPRFGWDFRYQYYAGAEAVVDGRPLYMDPDDPGLPQALDDVMTYVYPPLVAVALVPVTVLRIDVAQVLLFIASVAALVGTLALVGVRDIRCYAALFIWSPTWTALAVLNISSFLALAVALAWRYRAAWLPLAAAIGLAAASKVFLGLSSSGRSHHGGIGRPQQPWSSEWRRRLLPGRRSASRECVSTRRSRGGLPRRTPTTATRSRA